MKSALILLILCLSPVCARAASGDVSGDGVVDFRDFALLAEHWLERRAEPNNSSAHPKLEFGADSSALSFSRASVAYARDLSEIGVDEKRIERVCVASRPEVFINRDVARVSYDVDGEIVICGGGQRIYTTADGENFTEILNIQSNTPLESGGRFSDYVVPEEVIEGLRVMPDGSWLLGTGRKLMDVRGHLFRSTDKGLSWSVCKSASDGSDFLLTIGYLPAWASIGIADNEVVLGEYGMPQYLGPRRIYYSDDYGASWTMIIDVGPSYVQHCHAVCFGVGATDIVYASYGDGPSMRMKKFVCTGDKKNPADWTEAPLKWPLFVHDTDPVCLFNDGSHIYVGRDAGNSPTLWRFDSEEDREDLISFPAERTDAPEAAPYQGPNGGGTYVFRMVKHDGLFYAAVSAHNWQKRMAGIYVSEDGRHWVCARRFWGERGPYLIVGHANGYMWGTYMENDETPRLLRFSPVNAATVSALRLEPGIVNVADSADQSCFDAAPAGWTASGNIESLTWTDTGALVGGGSVKAVSGDDLGDKGYVYTQYFEQMAGLPNPGDYICLSAWVKAAPSWPGDASLYLIFENSTNIEYGGGRAVISRQWERVVVWAKCTGTPSALLRAKFMVDATGYRGSFSDLTWYADGFQVVYFPDIHYSGAWQKGGTARADEFAAFPLTGLSGRFSLALTWLPDCGWQEWHADCPIATIFAFDGSRLEVFWDQSEREFAVTDGTNVETIQSQGMGVWEHPDIVKLMVVSDGQDTDLYVENSVNGIAAATGAGGCRLTDAPAYIVLSSNAQRTRLGRGLFAGVRAWDSVLSPEDIAEAFDTVK